MVSFTLPDDVVFTCTVTGSSIVLKPGASTRTTYWPGVSAPEAYRPEEFVAWRITLLVALSMIVTFAPATTAPLWSVTVP